MYKLKGFIRDNLTSDWHTQALPAHFPPTQLCQCKSLHFHEKENKPLQTTHPLKVAWTLIANVLEYLPFLAHQWSFIQSKKQKQDSLLTLSPQNIIIIKSYSKGIENHRFWYIPGCLSIPFDSKHLNKFIINNLKNIFYLCWPLLPHSKIQHNFLYMDSSSF